MITIKAFSITCILRYSLILSLIITYSVANEYIYKANNMYIITNIKTPYELFFVDSPNPKRELRESTVSIGAEFMGVIYRYEPKNKTLNEAEALSFFLIVSASAIIGAIIGVIASVIISVKDKNAVLDAVLDAVLGAVLVTNGVMYDHLPKL